MIKRTISSIAAGAGLSCLAAINLTCISPAWAQTGDSLQQAYKDYSAKNFAAATPELLAIIRKSTEANSLEILNAYKMLANIYLQQNQIPQAVPEMEAVARLDPKDAATRSNLGIAYLQTGEAAKAVGVFQSLLAQNPKSADYAFQYADALERGGRHAEAAAAFEKAAALDPKDSRAPLYAGQIYHQEVGDDAKAVPDLKAALARGVPDKFAAYTALAEAAANTAQNSDAIEDYTQAAQAKPDDFGTEYNLGVLKQNAGKPAAAEAAYRQALSLKAPNPKSAAALRENLAGLLKSDGKLEEAATLLAQAALADPSDVSVEDNLGTVYEKQGKNGLALAAYQQALLINSGDAVAQDGIARLSKP